MGGIGRLGPDVATVGTGGVVSCQRAIECRVFVQHERIIHGHGQRVGRQAVDGDGDGRFGRITIFVGNGVPERLGECLSRQEPCHLRVGIVQLVAVCTVGVQGNDTIAARARSAQGAACNPRHRPGNRRAIGADGVVGEGVTRHRGPAPRDVTGVVGSGGRVVDDLDHQVANACLRPEAGIRDHQRDGVGELSIGWQRVGDGSLERVRVSDVRAGGRT